jgi:hypothetical protein
MIEGTSKSGNGKHTDYILHGTWEEGIRLGDNIWLAAPVNQETVIIQNTYYMVHEQRVYANNQILYISTLWHTSYIIYTMYIHVIYMYIIFPSFSNP